MENYAPKLFVYLMGQDDPERCTADKLARLRLAIPVRRKAAIPRRAIVLDPYAPRTLMRLEKGDLASHGLVAIDCSWEKARHALTGLRGETRRLPALLAANPTKFSQLGILSSVEALAAGLYITGFEEQARLILSKFKWGPHFLVLNEEPLKEYASAGTEDEVAKIEQSYWD